MRAWSRRSGWIVLAFVGTLAALNILGIINNILDQALVGVPITVIAFAFMFYIFWDIMYLTIQEDLRM